MDNIKMTTTPFVDVQVQKDCGCRGSVKAVPYNHGEVEIHQCNRHSWGGHEYAFALAFISIGALGTSLVWVLFFGGLI